MEELKGQPLAHFYTDAFMDRVVTVSRTDITVTLLAIVSSTLSAAANETFLVSLSQMSPCDAFVEGIVT